MERRPVSSSNIASIGWEPDEEGAGTMEVDFHSGHIYRYRNVPETVFQAALGASSVGKFIARSVIGVFDEERLK